MKTVERPLLTIAIPAFNVEKYIVECLSSFKNYGPDLLEILVINDGSTDGTKNVVQSLMEKSHIIKLINQPNGGHGATINTAIAKARGKYFKLLDGDDWFDNKQFNLFLKKLQNESADLILTEHIEILQKSQKQTTSHYYDNIKPNIIFDLDSIRFKKYGPTLPNTTVKTSILKQAHFKIDEHCYYVDQEYDFIVYTYSQTIIKYDATPYCYRLEQEGQSMSPSSLAKNVSSHERIILRLIKETEKNTNLHDNRIEHLYNNIIIPLCNLQYEITIKYCHSKKDFLSFDAKLKKYPKIYNNPLVAGNIIKIHRKTNGLSLPLDSLLSRLGKIKHPK